MVSIVLEELIEKAEQYRLKRKMGTKLPYRQLFQEVYHKRYTGRIEVFGVCLCFFNKQNYSMNEYQLK